MIQRPDDSMRLVFSRLVEDERHGNRVIVDEQSQKFLDWKCISRLCYFNPSRMTYTEPENLAEILLTAEHRASKIWLDYTFVEIGRKMKRETRSLSMSSSAGEFPGRAVSNNFMAATKKQKIEDWSKQVTETADPNTAVSEPPAEPPPTGWRRVPAPSDDEDEDEVSTKSVPIAESVASLASVELPNGARLLEVDSAPRANSFERSGEVVSRPTTSSEISGGDPQPPLDATRAIQTSRPGPGRGSVLNAGDSLPPSGNPARAVGNDVVPQYLRQAVRSSERLPVASTNPYEPLTEPPRDTSPDIAPTPHLTPKTSVLETARATGKMTRPRRGGRGSHVQTRVPTDHAQQSQRGGRPGVYGHAPTPPAQQLGGNPNDWQTVGRGRGSPHIRTGTQASPPGGQALSQPYGRGGGMDHGRGRGRADSNVQTSIARAVAHRSRNDLVDVTSSPHDGAMMPPPGFDIRLVAPEPTPPVTCAILDAPLDAFLEPLVPPTTPSPVSYPEQRARVSPPASVVASATGANYANNTNQGLDIEALGRERIAELTQQMQQMATERRRNETLTEESDFSRRPLHRTTKPRAGNSAAKKGTPRKMQPSEKERKNKLQSYFSEESAASKKPSLQAKPSAPEPMSAKKASLMKKSGALAEMNPELAEKNLRHAETDNLVIDLAPIFDASRAFYGALKFEVQLGQVLIPWPNSNTASRYRELKDWKSLFYSSHGQAPLVGSFTNILTTNGADVDRMLEMRSSTKGGAKMWDKFRPGAVEVKYEFTCQTTKNVEFKILVDQGGTAEIIHPVASIGMVNLHYPGQVWDACVVLSGVMSYDPEDAVSNAIKEFLESIYVSGDVKHVAIMYRLPATSEMTVKDLIMRRTSIHGCHILDRGEFQLKVTEVQTLYHHFKRQNKRLGQGFAKDYEQMVQDGRIHYEVALINTEIDGSLDENKELELGELTSGWTVENLLNKSRLRALLDLTTHLVTNIDWMGARNIGTLRRMQEERAPQHPGSVLDPAAGFSRIGGSRMDRPPMTTNVGDVRGGPASEWEVGDNGQRYWIGYGGAKVPINEEDVIVEEEVAPVDSASQAGAVAGRDAAGSRRDGPSGVNIGPRGQGKFW